MAEMLDLAGMKGPDAHALALEVYGKPGWQKKGTGPFPDLAWRIGATVLWMGEDGEVDAYHFMSEEDAIRFLDY